MIAIAKLAASVMGSNTYLNGLACTASSPASMVINIAPGEIYSLQNIDSTAYSSLPADTAHSILKQGILLSATSFTLAAPSTAGQSINYLIQVAFQDVDSGATVLPYYNASNPSQAYSGPNNSGIAQNTIRSGVCSVSVKTGVSATTGSQVTPPPDAGYVGAYVVTVNQGQTTITSTSINLAANAPFLPKNGLVSGVQSNTMNYSADTGTANNYVASYFPAVTQLTDGLRLTFKAKNSNTASSTFSPNGLASAPIYTRAAGALTGGEIAQNKIMEVEWNSTLSAWTLISGSDPLAIGALQKSANLSEIKGAGAAAVAATLANLGISGNLIPVGIPLPWPAATPPDGWLKCNGSVFDKNQLPQLALVYPSGRLPDLRGEFLRGWDDGRGVDSGRGLLTVESDEIRSHRHAKLNIDVSGVAYGMAAGNYSGQQTGGFYSYTTIGYDSGAPGIETGATGGSETRPRNIAFNYIVRAI
ncbi:phage tail protein [Yersinia enterocolitica]|uniref:phage tail protein n=1 Tax=Yersinia enterocolitica TaxID=630 RepID=UPI003F4617C5